MNGRMDGWMDLTLSELFPKKWNREADRWSKLTYTFSNERWVERRAKAVCSTVELLQWGRHNVTSTPWYTSNNTSMSRKYTFLNQHENLQLDISMILCYTVLLQYSLDHQVYALLTYVDHHRNCVVCNVHVLTYQPTAGWMSRCVYRSVTSWLSASSDSILYFIIIMFIRLLST